MKSVVGNQLFYKDVASFLALPQASPSAEASHR